MARPELVCPRCRSALEGASPTACTGCGAVYEAADGVPVLARGRPQRAAGLPAGVLRRRVLRLRALRASELAAQLPRADRERARRPRGGGPYLDVGVGGSGATVIEVARAGVDAVGCDLSVPGVVQARRFAAAEGVDDRAAFVVCEAEALPFADGPSAARASRCVGSRASGAAANGAFGSASAVAVLEHPRGRRGRRGRAGTGGAAGRSRLDHGAERLPVRSRSRSGRSISSTTAGSGTSATTTSGVSSSCSQPPASSTFAPSTAPIR